MKNQVILFLCLFFWLPMEAVAAAATDRPITIVGSSTVFPFAEAVAKTFSEKTGMPLPQITPTGSGGGLLLFCAGNGEDTPDVTNASRRIKRSEFDLCLANGVRDILEIKIGYGGIVLANSRSAPNFHLTIPEIYLALAARIPDPEGAEQLVANPYTNWRQINPALPDMTIDVLGPPPTSGTRDAFVELALERGCEAYPWLKQLKKRNKSEFRRICHEVRDDGYFTEAGERDDLTVENLRQAPQAMGLFGYNFLARDREHLQGALIDKVAANVQTIASGRYPLSRSLYIYIKADRVDTIPGLKDYLDEFTTDTAWGAEGYLSQLGLIPMPDNERRNSRRVFEERRSLVWE